MKKLVWSGQPFLCKNVCGCVRRGALFVFPLDSHCNVYLTCDPCTKCARRAALLICDLAPPALNSHSILHLKFYILYLMLYILHIVTWPLLHLILAGLHILHFTFHILYFTFYILRILPVTFYAVHFLYVTWPLHSILTGLHILQSTPHWFQASSVHFICDFKPLQRIFTAHSNPHHNTRFQHQVPFIY